MILSTRFIMLNNLLLTYGSTEKAAFRHVKIMLLILWLFIGLPCFAFASASHSDTALTRELIRKSESLRSVFPDSAIVLAQQALIAAEKSENQQYISLAHQELGRCLIKAERFEDATSNFLEALKIEENRDDKLRIADLSDDMGTIYYYLERFETSLDYHKRSLALYSEMKDSAGIARVLSHIGSLHASRRFCENRSNEEQKNDFETAIVYYHQSLEICRLIHDQESAYNGFINLGNVHKNLNNTDSASWYLKEALEYYQTANNPSKLSRVYYNLGLLYTHKKEYTKAIDWYRQSEAISEEYGFRQGIQFLYAEMAYTYEVAGLCKESKEYYVRYMTLRDSIYNSKKTEQIFELETRYQTEKKEKEILTLSLEKKRRNFFIILLTLIMLFIVVTAWYALSRIRQRQVLAEHEAIIKDQKIKEFEQERMLIATQSVLTGQETERRRLARDLHDGLGGMLSGIKLKLTSMKGNFILDEKGKSDFENALELLDKSVHELRQVAHNMMPEALMKFGLKEALDDYCSSLNNPSGIILSFRFYGEQRRIDQAIEIALFRIAQELINNAVKHSQGTEILADLVQDSDRISLTVQDNGKGFNSELASASQGIGLGNLKSRVAALKGHFEMNSNPGQGTDVKVEFLLN